MRQLVLACAALGLAALSPAAARAGVIDNDVPAGTVGQFSVDLTTGGESRNGRITGVGTPSGTVHSDVDILFDYFSYVDPGNNGGGFQLSGGAPVSTGDDQETSSGSFTGVNGTVFWSVTSHIPNGGDTMTSTFTFTAATGTTLGALRFLQYLDEDVLGAGGDVFFTRGSLAGNDLLLFTMDSAQAIGISHGGAYSAAMGLVNAAFAGWSAAAYNQIKPRITGAGEPVSTSGVNNIGSSFVHPLLGLVYGPLDVVSVLAWDVDPNATTATIITTLGGVPDVREVPPVVPLPPAAWMGLALLGGLGARRRLQRSAA